MQTIHNSTMLRRLEQMLERHVRELEQRKQALRDALTNENGGFRAESEWGFARDARGLGAGLLSISAPETVQSIEDALRRLRGRHVRPLRGLRRAHRSGAAARPCLRTDLRRVPGAPRRADGALPAWAA